MKALRKISVLAVTILFFMVGLCFGQSAGEQSLTTGVEYAAQGKFKEAREEFQTAFKVDPSLKSAKVALQVIQDVADQKIEGKTAIHFFKGAAYVIKDQWGKAISEYNKAIELNPWYATAYVYRGLAYDQGKGQYDQAISDYSKAIEINPRYGMAYVYRGLAYEEGKGQYDQAFSDYSRAIEINLRNDEAYFNRGLLYFKERQYDSAISDYSRAIEINRRYTEAYHCRAVAYAKGKGQYDQAISDFTKAIEIDPRYTQAYVNRGLIYMARVGNREKACSDWKWACELGDCSKYTIAKRRGYCK